MRSWICMENKALVTWADNNELKLESIWLGLYQDIDVTDSELTLLMDQLVLFYIFAIRV